MLGARTEKSWIEFWAQLHYKKGKVFPAVIRRRCVE